MKVVQHNGHPHVVTRATREQAIAQLGCDPELLASQDKFWIAHPGFPAGVLVLASDYTGEVVNKSDRKQIVAFYANARMWHSYGRTLEEAVTGAQADAWKYMSN